MRLRSLVFASTIVALIACAEREPAAPRSPRPLADLSDGEHGGNTHFFFLPPMVQAPNLTGVFDGSLLGSTSVEICEWAGVACTQPLTARYTSTAGVGSEVLRVVPEDRSEERRVGRECR